ncbi:aromatic-L-amino-acid decarboxylase [Condylostylus longicornis]|uniref:aromatic-L-amino-acid decarboxylase n=1 Tax=Condylostylus longicornis TaxID=2530218 RepID=UPI00244DC539|nr:aromatic-L-amino-acid decarboxylase [Condylostylus longicornis]
MNTEQFKKYGYDVIEYICDYNENIGDRDVAPTIDPGYLKDLIPSEAPLDGEDFENVLKDFENKIMPGVVHWNHPKFFAYFPAANSYPSILGDMLSSALGSIGFSWASCPAATELETIVLDWYAKALNLPKFFLSNNSINENNKKPNTNGGGALQGSASECALICLIAARARVIRQLKSRNGNENIHDSVFLPHLIAYASREAHSSIEKAAKMALVKLRIIEVDSRCQMKVDLLQAAIQNDINHGLTPFFVVATVGTTGSCAFDDIVKIGKICKEHKCIWFHVDGAYAGNSFILPEMRNFSKGLKYADSFNTNPNKLLLTNFDCSALWVKNVLNLTTALTVNPLYLRHEHKEGIDLRHYGIPLSRRFRALKLWFVFRTYGIKGIQKYIRNHIYLAKKFEMLVNQDNRFEVTNDVYLGLVCFRLKSSDEINQDLLAQINHSGKMHMIPAMINGKYVIRFCVTYEHANEKHIEDAFKDIKSYADEILAENPLKQIEYQPNKVEDEVKKVEKTEPKQTVSGRQVCPKKKLTRTKSLRFSFTRSISREIFESQNEHLTDGCTPILVIGQDDLNKSFLEAMSKQNKLKDISDVDSDEISN